MKRILGLLISLPLATPGWAAPEAGDWGKVEGWAIKRGDKACLAGLGTGTGVVAVVRRFDGTNLFEFADSRVPAGTAGLTFVAQSKGQPLLRLPLAVDAEDQELAGSVSAQDLPQLYLVEAYTVSPPKGHAVATGALPEMARLASQLDRCVRESKATDHGSGKPPVGKPRLLSAQLLTDADYPPKALREEAHGRTLVTLTVSARGNVSGCEVKTSSGFALLDEATCTVLSRRARYVPAKDASGANTESTTDQGLNWQIPQ